MDTPHGRVAPRVPLARVALVLALATAGLNGCKSAPTNPFQANSEMAQPRAAEQVAIAREPLDLSLLTDAGWFEQPPESYAARGDDELRWHHAGLDGYLHPSAPRADLTSSLASTDAVIAVNAAILAAHWGTADPSESLVKAIRSEKLSPALRGAAAEALGRMQAPSPGSTLRELLADFTPPSAGPGQPPHVARRRDPSLHADLLRALARHAEPGDEEFFDAALADPDWHVRLEGIAAWTALADLQLPPDALALCSDRDDRVRATALRMLAARRDPRAGATLRKALADPSPEVQAAAMAALAELGTADARAALARLEQHGQQFRQAAALASDAVRGLGDEAQELARQTASQTRLAVAQSLDDAQYQGRQLAAETMVEARGRARNQPPNAARSDRCAQRPADRECRTAVASRYGRRKSRG